jgi:hypothetical protein
VPLLGFWWMVGNSEIIPPIDDSNLASNCTKNGVFTKFDAPMSVTGQIVQHMFRSAKGRLGIHDPLLLNERAQKGSEVPLLGSAMPSQ